MYFFFLLLFIQITIQKIIHTLENLFIVCIWAYKKFCTRRKGKPLGSGLVEASGDLAQKEGSRLPSKPQQAGRSGEGKKLWCRLLVSLKRGRWLEFWFQLAGEGFQVWVVFSSWTGRTGCDEQVSVAWGLSCSSRQGSGGGLPYGSCSVKYTQAIISIAFWEKSENQSTLERNFVKDWIRWP